MQPAEPGALLPRAPAYRVPSPAAIYRLAGRLVPWFAISALLLTLAAVALALSSAPKGLQQDGTWGVALVHGPAAWVALSLYVAMAACAVLALGLDARLPVIAMAALAPAGAMFTLIALWTGTLLEASALSPGSWDAHLAAEAILLLVYGGLLALRWTLRADRACAALVLVGMFNLPIIYYSVRWWSTLHQASGIGAAGPPAMAHGMLAAAVATGLAFCLYAFAGVLSRVRRLMRKDPANLDASQEHS